jgi:hypothetical protein
MGDLDTANGVYSYIKAKANTAINYFKGRAENYWGSKDTAPEASATACSGTANSSGASMDNQDHVILDRIDISAIMSKHARSECTLHDVFNNAAYGATVQDRKAAFWKDVAEQIVNGKFSVETNGLATNQKESLINELTKILVEKLADKKDLVADFLQRGKYLEDCRTRNLLDNSQRMNLGKGGITVTLVKGLITTAKALPAQGGTGTLDAASMIGYLRNSENANIRSQVLKAVTPLYSVCDPDAKVSLGVKNAKGKIVSASFRPETENVIVFKGLENYLIENGKLPKGFTISFGDDKNIIVDQNSITWEKGIGILAKVSIGKVEKSYGLKMSIVETLKDKEGKEKTFTTIVAERENLLTVKKGGGGGERDYG